MEPGTDVRERITGKRGVVIGRHRDAAQVHFPSIAGNLNLDGTYDSGVREIPFNMLEQAKLPVDAVMEAVANVLQAER